jgi:hypothetical protein
VLPKIFSLADLKPKRRSLLSKMWLGKPESAEAIFNDLFNEVRSAAPAAQLSYNLRCRLERVEFRSRSEICSRYRSLNRNKKNNCSL